MKLHLKPLWECWNSMEWEVERGGEGGGDGERWKEKEGRIIRKENVKRETIHECFKLLTLQWMNRKIEMVWMFWESGAVKTDPLQLL